MGWTPFAVGRGHTGQCALVVAVEQEFLLNGPGILADRTIRHCRTSSGCSTRVGFVAEQHETRLVILNVVLGADLRLHPSRSSRSASQFQTSLNQETDKRALPGQPTLTGDRKNTRFRLDLPGKAGGQKRMRAGVAPCPHSFFLTLPEIGLGFRAAERPQPAILWGPSQR